MSLAILYHMLKSKGFIETVLFRVLLSIEKGLRVVSASTDSFAQHFFHTTEKMNTNHSVQ